MAYLTIIGAVFVAWLILALLFTPHIPYHVESAIDARTDHFVHVLESTCQTHLEHGNRVEILTNGDRFYPVMLDAIRGARETITMECYIFKSGETGDRFIEALTERARAGVRVTIVMDAIGSFGAFRQSAQRLRQAGCRVAAYQRFTWYRLSRLNNRTHRELLADALRGLRRRLPHVLARHHDQITVLGLAQVAHEIDHEERAAFRLRLDELRQLCRETMLREFK
jgi:cardiolipin synthase